MSSCSGFKALLKPPSQQTPTRWTHRQISMTNSVAHGARTRIEPAPSERNRLSPCPLIWLCIFTEMIGGSPPSWPRGSARLRQCLLQGVRDGTSPSGVHPSSNGRCTSTHRTHPRLVRSERHQMTVRCTEVCRQEFVPRTRRTCPSPRTPCWRGVPPSSSSAL